MSDNNKQENKTEALNEEAKKKELSMTVYERAGTGNRWNKPSYNV